MILSPLTTDRRKWRWMADHSDHQTTTQWAWSAGLASVPTVLLAISSGSVRCKDEMERFGEKSEKRSGAGDDGGPSPKRRAKSQNHGYYCAVPECSNRSGSASADTKPLSFHRFPQNEARRKQWTVAIRREVGKNFQVTSNTRVCSAHFKEENFKKMTSYGAECHVRQLISNAVPSSFDWNDYGRMVPPARRVLVRHAPVKSTRQKLEEERERASSLALPAQDASACNITESEVCSRHPTPAPHPDHDCYTCRRPKTSMEEYVETLEGKIERLEGELADLRSRSISLEAIKDDDVLFKHCTGLPNVKVFNALLKYLTPKAKRLRWWRGSVTKDSLCIAGKRRGSRTYSCKLSISEHFFAVLVRLRTAVSVKEIAHRCDVSPSFFFLSFSPPG